MKARALPPRTKVVSLLPGKVTREWPWAVVCYYNDTVKYPKIPGSIAISTVHRSEGSARIEEAAAKAREDVTVDVIGPWHD